MLKRKFKCTTCNKIYSRQMDMCSCGKAGPLQDVTPGLTDAQKKSYETRRLRQRSKTAERRVSKIMALVDGEDPNFEKIASKNGRVGFINHMQIDAVSRSYVTEAKNRKLPAWMLKAWILVQQKGREHGKNVLMYIQPPNMPIDISIRDLKIRSENLHIITESRHEELIRKEKALDALKVKLDYLPRDSRVSDALIAAEVILLDKNKS